MAIKVFIRRHFKEGTISEAISLLNQFRSQAMAQPGYISGETLVNHYDKRSITVVSTWQAIEDWIKWQESDDRSENEAQIESLLEDTTKYEIYDVGSVAEE